MCLNCEYHAETGEYLDIPDLPPKPPKEDRVPLPKCELEGCEMPATYDFLTTEDSWAYGCTTHWMKNRKTKQLGPGIAQHLTDGNALPERPTGAVLLAKPDGSLPDVTKSAMTRRAQVPRGNGAPRVRLPKEFFDMEPSPEGQKQPKSGVQLVALELSRTNDGFTLEELQAEISKQGSHDAMKLMSFMHTDRGWGWKKGEDGKIRVLPG